MNFEELREGNYKSYLKIKKDNIDEFYKDERLQCLSKLELELLYKQFSNRYACNWISLTDDLLKEFKKWCFTTPFQEVLNGRNNKN